jgi:O-6-methylguanine DNA methyltransferase
LIRLYQAFIETPVATMRAISMGDALCSLEFFRKGRMARLDARLARWFKEAEIVERTTPMIDQTREWLRGYFAGESADISHLELEMRGAPFELRVWKALRRIPPGTTTTYGAIAREIGSPDASRAVGMANGANPIAIIVPCHRVIGSNGTLTGYGGGLETKSWLLSHERRWAKEPALF